MNYYKAKIQYDGHNFAGFQWQKSAVTIQSIINDTLTGILNCKVTTSAASRTDTGVHALDQILKICSQEKIDCQKFLNQINKELPRAIRFKNLTESTWDYKPSIHVKSKEYRYYFTNDQIPKREFYKYCANISGAINIQSIQKCCNLILGEHDFCNFTNSGSNVVNTVRNVSLCQLSKINSIPIDNDLFCFNHNATEIYEFKIIANGFLKQMIRNLVSALWRVGTNKLSIEEFEELLNGEKINKQLWRVAPAGGLFLFKIEEF